MKIALISCTSSKKSNPCKASEMYSVSPRFSLAYKYAKNVSDVVYILSAKYGLISEDEIIEPYNETLVQKSKNERIKWSNDVIRLLESKHSIESDIFLILSGKAYYEFLLPELKHYEIPLKGQSLGRWIPKLKELIDFEVTVDMEKSKSLLIHELMTNLPRYNWETINNIPFNNGIYIMFESGEKFCGMERIVRIGTHRADGRLKERLRDHFLKENKDGSILRKNIGLSLLRKNNDIFKSIWALDWSNPEIKREFSSLDNMKTKKEIEKLVSSYLRENIQFTCINVEDEIDRLKLENALISTLNKAVDFKSSTNWLGRFSPKKEISLSGLWNTQGLNGNEFSRIELEDFKSFVLKETPFLKKEKSFQVHPIKKKTAVKLLNKEVSYADGKVTTSDIRVYIKNIIENARTDGFDYIDIVSGEIHKQMCLQSRMPSVCRAMYQMMGKQDVVLYTTPSGKSSTIKIRYYL